MIICVFATLCDLLSTKTYVVDDVEVGNLYAYITTWYYLMDTLIDMGWLALLLLRREELCALLNSGNKISGSQKVNNTPHSICIRKGEFIQQLKQNFAHRFFPRLPCSQLCLVY